MNAARPPSSAGIGSRLKRPSANEIVAASEKYGPQPQSCTVAATCPMPIGPEICGAYFANCVTSSTMPAERLTRDRDELRAALPHRVAKPTRSYAGTGEKPMQPSFLPTCGGHGRGVT